MAIRGWSRDCQSNSGVWGYSNIGRGVGVEIRGWSRDCQSNSGVQGYSDIRRGEGERGIYGGGGGGYTEGGRCQSTDGPGTVKVTPVYGDTLT